MALCIPDRYIWKQFSCFSDRASERESHGVVQVAASANLNDGSVGAGGLDVAKKGIFILPGPLG